jgi:hypothetical protein
VSIESRQAAAALARQSNRAFVPAGGVLYSANAAEWGLRANEARRRFLRGAVQVIGLLACSPPLVLSSAIAKPEESAMLYPLVPFSTVVDSWDHHWFLWLPLHPAYESVEVASRELDRDGRVDIWVWFTERAGAKRQIHYRNSALLADFVGGHDRLISYQISGDDGRPRGVQVRFDDIENVPVDIEVEFEADQMLDRQRAGLTDQSGHIRDRAFLIFYRDTNAQARYGRASIGSKNYTFDRDEAKGGFPFKWSYSHGISINLILYNSFTARFGPGGFTPSPMADSDYVLNRAGYGSVVLVSDPAGQLSEYVDHGANGDFLRIVFDPPLPACDHGNKLQSSSFSVSIRAAADLIRGSVESRCGDHVQVLDWHPSQPTWASRQPFRSEISRPDDHSCVVVVTSAP